MPRKKKKRKVRISNGYPALHRISRHLMFFFFFALSEDELLEDWPDGTDYKTASVDHLRRILNKEGTYYPVMKGCDNPYRDGYVTEPPKKPRASYLFFQATVRSYISKMNPKAPQAELMIMLGEIWRAMDDNERGPWLALADEEVKQFAKERVLLEKAQRPNGVWQPIRRCLQVLDRLSKDSFADIFLEPVSKEDFPDYDEIIDVRMDLGTVRQRIENRKYQGPEQFARDMRRVSENYVSSCCSFFLCTNSLVSLLLS